MSIKKVFCYLLATAALVSCVAAAEQVEYENCEALEIHVQSEEVELFAIKEYTTKDGNYTYEVDTQTKTATLVSVSENLSSVEIKDKIGESPYNSYGIVAVANNVGYESKSITSVSFEKATNLISIGENCFSYCPNLKNVAFRKNNSKLDSIGNNAFYYCPNLSGVTYADKQTNLSYVGSSVFGLTKYIESRTEDFVKFGNALLKYNGTDTSVTIPDGITVISDAFFGKEITSVNLNKVEYIGNNAFYGCRKLEELVIPESCTKIGDMSFAGCSSLKKVEYLGKLSSVGFCSFANCGKLVSFVYGGSESSVLTYIGECAFWNDNKLYWLDTGNLENVNVGSFWYCFGETPEEVGAIYYYRIPKTVKSIAEGGYGNLEFSFVTVPDSVEAFASTAFGSTTGARYIIKKGTKAEEYFKNSGYKYYNYGDMSTDGKITAKDISTIAEYIAKGISDINANYGYGVIADIDCDNKISIKDLHDVFESVKEEYESENTDSN